MLQLFYYNNATIVYYKTPQVSFKKIATTLLPNMIFVTISDTYYKMHRHTKKGLIENDLPIVYINKFEITRESVTKSLGICI